jgi:predicted acyl esterase
MPEPDAAPRVTPIYPRELVRSPEPPPGVTLDETVPVAMRDGIRLCVDVYRPQAAGRYPALLSVSPYSKDIQQKPPHWSHAIESGATGFYVPKGYAHVIAQARGAGYSQGQWNFLDAAEQHDGYDLVEWIAQQPWCDGNVGMIGDSYWSWSQYHTAAEQPPHLRCICPCDGTTDIYRDLCYQGGVYHHAFLSNWIEYHTAMMAWPGAVDGKLAPMNLTYELACRPYDGPWYWERSAHGKLDRIRVPVMSIAPQGGQTHFRGQLWGYPQIAAPKKLLVVPPTGFWSHLRYLTNAALNRQMLRWFDHWLKGIDTGIVQEPEVAIFDAGTRAWRYENEYPLARTQWTPFYLGAGAAGPATQPPYGLLSREMPGEQDPDRYRMPDSYAQLTAGKSVVSYLTPPLERDLRVWGPASLTLHASSSAPDTVWFVKVFDVPPSAPPQLATRGILKASFRAVDQAKSKPGQPYHPFRQQDLLEPGRVYDFEIELSPLCRTFRRGHRIELQIASEDIQYTNPLRQIDLQLLPWPVENAIHHDRSRPSHLLLPLIPDTPEIRPVEPPLSDIDWPLVPGSWMPNTDGFPLRD